MLIAVAAFSQPVHTVHYYGSNAGSLGLPDEILTAVNEPMDDRSFEIQMPSSLTENPALQALPDGQWSQLPESGIDDLGSIAVPCCNYGLGCDVSGITSYSGATLDQQRQAIVLWGGGHNDYFGNQLYSFDIAKLQWSLSTQPTSLCLFSNPPDYMFTNGLPVSRHTYDHMDYIDHLNVFFAYSGATSDSPPFNGGDSYGDMWTYDFNQQSWNDLTNQQSGDLDYYLSQPGASGEYDPVTQMWYQVSAYGVWAYDFSDNSWTKVNEDGHPGIERVSVLDPVRRLIWSYGGDYGGDAILSSYAIDSNQFLIVDANSLPGIRSAAGLTYDVSNDQLVLFGGETEVDPSDINSHVYNYDIDTGSWAVYSSLIGPGGDDRTYGRFLYEPINNVFFLIKDTSSVWVWKNTLADLSDLIFADGYEVASTIINGASR